MNILWVADKYLDVSVDRVTWTETTKGLEKLGHSVLLLTVFKKERPSFGLEGRIRYLPCISIKVLGLLTSNISIFVYIGYYLFAKRPNILIVHPTAFLAILPFSMMRKLKLIKTKFVLDISTIPVEVLGISEKIKEKLFNVSIFFSKYLFDGITVITPFMKEILSQRFNLKNHTIGIWSSGASLDVLDPGQVNRAQIQKLREELDLRDRFTIMYHGVFTETRGLEETIEALSLLREKGIDVVLLLVGDGRARAALENKVNTLKLADRVVIKGPIPHDEIPLHIASADVGILPFPKILWWRVSSPIKLMEYLAMGKPVIITDIEAHQDVLNSNKCGIYISSNSSSDIAQGVSYAYKKWKHLDKIGLEGIKVVRDKYTWDIQAARLEEYLMSIY